MNQQDNPLWVEKWRPTKISQTILPKSIKQTFQKFVDDKSIPVNLLLSGAAGTGKTTAARALLEEIGAEYVIINGSMNGNIDTLRNDIKQFASQVSIMGNDTRKFVILDEADYLTGTTQAALRNFMEEYSKFCGFILTCNFKHKIIEPLWSRCSVIEFKIPNSEKPVLAGEFMKRLMEILTEENVKFDRQVLATVITKWFPDWRRILNEIQRYSVIGEINSGILANFQDANIKELIGFMKERKFSDLRKWVANNSDMDAAELFNTLYEHASQYFETSTIPAVILVLAKYQYQHAFVANPEINTTACLTEIMLEAKFK